MRTHKKLNEKKKIFFLKLFAHWQQCKAHYSLVALHLARDTQRNRIQFCKYRMNCARCTESEISSLAIYIELVYASLTMLHVAQMCVLECIWYAKNRAHFSSDFYVLHFLYFPSHLAVKASHTYTQININWQLDRRRFSFSVVTSASGVNDADCFGFKVILK